MTDNPKSATPACPDEGRARFYGFAPKKRHFIWRSPEEVEPAPLYTENFAGGEVERAPTELLAGVEVEPAASDATSIAVLSEAEPSRRAATTEAIVLVEPALEIAVETVPGAPPEEQRRKRTSPRRKKRNRRKLGRKNVRQQPQLPSPTMHEAQCMICRSKWRDEMDELFVNWHNFSEISREYHTPRRVIYRHANAVGLFPIRDRNLRRSLGLIIHRAETAPDVTADSVIRADRTLAHINDAGEWVQPPTHVIVSSGTRLSDQDSRPEQSRGSLHANTTAPSAPKLLDTPCQAIESVKP